MGAGRTQTLYTQVGVNTQVSLCVQPYKVTSICVTDHTPGQYRPIHALCCAVRACIRQCFPGVQSMIHLLHTRLGITFFSSFFLKYSQSKSSSYHVILDRLSGPYRELWTGPRSWGLASCMTTVMCRVIKCSTQACMHNNIQLCAFDCVQVPCVSTQTLVLK